MTSLRIALLFLWVATPVLLGGCDDAPEPGTDILEIEGVDWACNVNTSYAVFGSAADSEDNPRLILPASDGDLLYMLREGLQFYYRYRNENGGRYSISFDTLGAVSASLNGYLSYMELSGPGSLDAFRQLNESELLQLDALLISEAPSEELTAFLELHEAPLRGKGLILEGIQNSAGVQKLLSLIRPGYLVLDNSLILPDPNEHLSLTNLELLWTQGNIQALARLDRCCNKLEALIVADWEPEQGELLPLSGLSKLHSLTIAESDLTTLSSIEFPGSLQNLYLVDCDTLSDIESIRHIGHLKRLSLLSCERIVDLDVLLEIDPLRSLSLPPEVTQEEFLDLSAGMISLEQVDLIDCPHISDLYPLQRLADLRVLQLQLDRQQLNGLNSLSQLELVILTSDLIEDNPSWINDLRTALPDTDIVPGSGLCLGSGWLLLLLPLVLVFRFRFRRKT